MFNERLPLKGKVPHSFWLVARHCPIHSPRLPSSVEHQISRKRKHSWSLGWDTNCMVSLGQQLLAVSVGSPLLAQMTHLWSISPHLLPFYTTLVIGLWKISWKLIWSMNRALCEDWGFLSALKLFSVLLICNVLLYADYFILNQCLFKIIYNLQLKC